MLLAQAGFIEAIDDNGPDTQGWIPTGLTWQGHEFLEAARDDSRWNRTMAIVKQSGGAVALESIKTILKDLMKQHFTGEP